MLDKHQILQLIKDTVHENEPDAEVILFGSYVRGDETDSSDIDLLILLKKDKIDRADQKRIKYPLYDIEYDIGIIISPLVMSRYEWENRHSITYFYENVLHEGRVL